MPRFDSPIHTSDQSIDRVLRAGFPVALVVVGDTLDGSLGESLRAVARADAGRLLVAQVKAADNPQIAAQVRDPLPALVTYREGDPVTRAGAISSQSFRAHVDYLLGRGPEPQPTAPARPQAGAQPGPHPATGAVGGAATGPARPVTVTDATFRREVLQSELPVLVDLWAVWCAPCRMIAPALENMARDYAGRLKIAKLNVDENPQTAGMLGVRSIPTLLVYRGGQIVDRIVGAAPEPALRQRVDALLR